MTDRRLFSLFRKLLFVDCLLTMSARRLSNFRKHCRLMEKITDNLLENPFGGESSAFGADDVPLDEGSPLQQEIVAAVENTLKMRSQQKLPVEKEVVTRKVATSTEVLQDAPEETKEATQPNKDLHISLRVAIRGFVISLVDAAPSEIAVVTLKNVNSIASWNVQRTTDATVFITVTNIQVDNMIPNAPFPVAVCADDKAIASAQPESVDDGGPPPVLVIGLSFAPRHRTGIVVSCGFTSNFVENVEVKTHSAYGSFGTVPPKRYVCPSKPRNSC